MNDSINYNSLHIKIFACYKNPPEDIMNANFELIEKFNLSVLLTPGRTNGVHSMLKEIKRYAKSFSKKN